MLYGVLPNTVFMNTLKSYTVFVNISQDLIEQRCTDATSDTLVAMDTTLIQMFTVYVKMLMHGCLEVCP